MPVNSSPQPTRRSLPIGSVQERQAGLPEPLRAFHRHLLAGFLANGGPPEPAAVADMASELGLDPHQALEVLAATDLVHRDPTSGRISVAYPFSGQPTLHQVELAGGPTVSAMCALDALGIPQMARRAARIRSTDPVSGQPTTVETHDGSWRWEPATTVVLVATAASGVCGAVADCCCPNINFHTDPQHAQTYLQAHPGMTGELLGQADAVETARRIFGGLLHFQQPAAHRSIGPIGTTARLLVGLGLVGSVALGHLARGFHLWSWALGLLAFPALLVAFQWLRARRTPTRLQATGPIGHALNLAVFLVLYLWEPTSDATLIFYGASMLLAALRGYGGCEVLAAPNWLLGRDDQIGCALFWPIDQREHRLRPGGV